MTHIAADIRAEAPAGAQDGPQLTLHLILNGVPGSAMPNASPDEGADDRIPFATVKLTHKVTPEEARSIRQLVPYTVALVVETDDGSGKPHVHPLVVARPKAP